MFTRIAVPLDGSVYGDCAIPYAAALAAASGGAVELLHVHQFHPPGEVLEAFPQYQFNQIATAHVVVDEDALEEEHARLRGIAARLGNDGVAATTRILYGRVAESLCEYTHSAGTDLVVMATHGRSGMTHSWLGSVTDTVVRRSWVPVLLVRPTTGAALAEGIRFRRILVPVDGSAFSAAILDSVTELARLTGADLSLLHVAGPAARPVRVREEYMESLAASVPADLPEPDTRVVTHPQAAVAIIEEAEAGEYDLIAMSTHGCGGLRYLFLGSTADKVLRGTRRPVLLFRPHLAVGARWPVAAPAEAAV